LIKGVEEHPVEQQLTLAVANLLELPVDDSWAVLVPA